MMIRIYSKNDKKTHDSLGFRAWYYFRMGWSTYFAFIFAAINTLTVTYYLAIENYPSLKEVFPSFEVYIIIICTTGIPLLTIVGYTHYKRTKARKAEVDILIETNPYVLRTLVNSDVLLVLNLKMINLLRKLKTLICKFYQLLFQHMVTVQWTFFMLKMSLA